MLIAHFIFKILQVTLKKLQIAQGTKNHLQGNFFFMGTHVNNLYARNVII